MTGSTREEAQARGSRRRGRLIVSVLALVLIAAGSVGRPPGLIDTAGATPAPPRAVHIYHPVDGRVVPWNAIDLLIYATGDATPVFSCALDGVAMKSCRNMTSFYATDGPHTLLLKGTYADGYVATATAAFTVDGPKLAITSPANNTSRWPNSIDVNATMTLSSAPDVWTYYGRPDFTYTCKLDAAAPVDCSFPFHYDGLSNGLHTIKVVATDSYSGKIVTASNSFQVVPPRIYYPSNGTVVPTNAVDFLLSWASPTTSCTLVVDGGTPAVCTWGSKKTLANGAHSAVLTATYAGGLVYSDTSNFSVAG